jgi:ABC-2 type transport system ATP-binding protein
MSDPELLILDEPTSGLDPVLQEKFRDLLGERKAEGASIWLTSHVMAEVERVADRVGLIRDGLLTRELAMEDLRRQASHRITFSFPTLVRADQMAGVPHVTGVEPADGRLVVTVDGPVTALLARAAELGATAVETERQDLDELFLEIFEPEATQT